MPASKWRLRPVSHIIVAGEGYLYMCLLVIVEVRVEILVHSVYSVHIEELESV